MQLQLYSKKDPKNLDIQPTQLLLLGLIISSNIC